MSDLRDDIANDAAGDLPFTLAGVRRGARQSIPLALGTAAYGLVFGALARQAGLGLTEVVSMSGLVYAGAAQLVALELWAPSLPVVAIVFTTLVINARHLLMGATLQPWFGRLSPGRGYGAMFFLTDESWALTQRDLQTERRDGAVMVGCGLVLMVAWVGSNAAGHTLGVIASDPARWGLDVAPLAVFAALLVAGWDGRGRLLPWLTAAIVAVITERILPGAWYVPAGGLAGGVIGALRDED